MLDVSIAPQPELQRLLEAHPRIGAVSVGAQEAALAWSGREILVGRQDLELRGIVELVDNNPLVCATRFSLPTAGATLALIALGPLARAGLIADEPTMLLNSDTKAAEVSPFLAPLGWSGGIVVAPEERDLGGVIAATVIAAVQTPERLEDLDDLFEEAYGRSFFVRHDDSSDWHVDLVRGKPEAAYRLRISPDEPQSLLTIQVMADRHGKCGAAQIVHAFNVMCGFEESLGVVQTH